MSMREFDEIPAIDQIDAWFSALSPDCRRALFAAPRGVVPAEFVADIERIGHAVAEPWFVRSTPSNAYRLPADAAGHIEQAAVELGEWWDGLGGPERDAWSSIDTSTPLSEQQQASEPQDFPAALGHDTQRYAAPVVVDFIAATSR